MGMERKESASSAAITNQSSGEAGPSTSARRFPLAAQPEIMRAAEKDDQYASYVYEACRDAFRHIFGSFCIIKLRVFLYLFYFIPVFLCLVFIVLLCRCSFFTLILLIFQFQPFMTLMLVFNRVK